MGRKNTLTVKDFINRVNKIHDNKYDYSKMNYINTNNKIIIICRKHGEFTQLAKRHLYGSGCPKCAIEKNAENKKFKAAKTFKEKAIKIHKDKYYYDKVNYINNKTKVIIICRKHGEFKQIPHAHLYGKGCPKCFEENRRLSIEEFINRSNKIHNNKYNYSEVYYKNNYTKIKIICSIHGVFEQIPTVHLNGSGCPKCSGNNKSTTEDFILKAIKVHNNKYDYSLVEYINAKTKIKIICKKHGIFKQTPNGHLNGKGCTECAIINIFDKLSLSSEQFIEKSIKVHCWKYNYKLINYINAKTHVKIICPTHGKFEQMPDVHLQGSGCPKCTYHISKPELEICTFLDSLNIDYEQSNRSIIKPYELDIVIPSKNVAIEFNGKYWHSDEMILKRTKGKLNSANKYHQMKTNMCNNKGYKLLHISEEDWINDKQKELNEIIKFIK